MNTDPEKVLCRWRQRWKPQDGTPREPGGAWSRVPLNLRRNSQHPISGSQTLAQELTEHCHLTSTSSLGNARPLSPLPPSHGPRGIDRPGMCTAGATAWGRFTTVPSGCLTCDTRVTPWSLWFPFHYRGRRGAWPHDFSGPSHHAFCCWQERTVKALCWSPGPKVSEKEEK